MKGIKYFTVIIIAGVFIASCSVTRPYQAPEVDTDSLYRGSLNGDTASLAALKWNSLFTDAYLQQLIAEALNNNLDLQIAYERLNQSQSYFQQSRAAFIPTLDANAGVSALRFSDAQNPTKNTGIQYQLGVASSWEVDVWGKLSSSRRAALANVLQTDAAARALRTAIVSGVANYYYLLLSLDRQLEITRETVKNWDITVETMKALKETNRVTEAAVVQSEAQRYAAEVTIPDLEQSVRETENALSILVGSHPREILRGKIEAQNITTPLEVGVPAQLLAYRPDVQQAEFNYRNAFELTNVARAYFYPSLSITGSTSVSSLALEKLFDPGAFGASIAGGLLQPILDRRNNKTRLEVAQSQQAESLLNFKATLLDAGREVSDALSSYATSIQKIGIRENQLSALEKSVEYSQELLQNGFATYTEVITARQSLLQAELGRVNDRLQQLQAVVNLYRALGGGWQ